MRPSQDIINTYLWFAYLPPKEIPTWLDDCITPENTGLTYTPEEAALKFDQLFDKLLSDNSAEKHIIPLSGGWDSRAILGALLERLETSQIETVTFGVPGQLDYDIGVKVAQRMGVKNHTLDLRTVNFTWETICDSVKKSPWTYVPDGYFNQIGVELLSNKNNIIWSGFLGDAINGGHMHSVCYDLNQQLQVFVNKEQRLKTFDFVSENYNPYNWFIPNISNKLHHDVSMFFGFHCTACTTPINLPTADWAGWYSIILGNNSDIIYYAPFVDSQWAGYWLQAPRNLLYKQNLFFSMMSLKFPTLSSLPGKSTLGLPASATIRKKIKNIYHGLKRKSQKTAPWLGVRSAIHQNYLDYDVMFRNRQDYKETLDTAFSYLKTNNITPWLDLDKLWNEHMRKRKEHGVAFQIILGLAANLKENKIPDSFTK